MKFIEFADKVIKDIFIICYKEMKNVFKDSGVIIFFLLVPLAYPVLYGIIYNKEIVEEVPLAVIDLSNSSYSREFIRNVDAASEVKVAANCTDMIEAKRVIDEKKAYGILFIPEDFSKNLYNKKQTNVSLYCDMGSLLYYKAFLLTVTEVSLNMGKKIQINNMNGTTSKSEEILTQAITYESVALYNTQNGFASFLVPAILILVIQQTLLLGIGMLAATARERNYSKQLIPVDNRHTGTLRVVLGKSLTYFLIYIPVCIWSLLIVPYIFNLPQIAQPGAIGLFTLPYLFASVFFAMSVSCFMRERENPLLLLVFTSLPLLFLSGISWPKSAISEFWQWIGLLFPSTPGIRGFVKINSMGAGLSEVSKEYQILWLQTGIYFITTCILYRWQIIQASKIRKNRLEKMRENVLRKTAIEN